MEASVKCVSGSKSRKRLTQRFAVIGCVVLLVVAAQGDVGRVAAQCITCVAGEEFNSGTSVCDPCAAGFSCAGGCDVAVQCLAGTYAPAGSTACSACDVGAECPNDGMSAPQLCSLGTIQTVTGQTSCDVCPAGSSCPNPAQIPRACPRGSTSTTGQGSCTPCSAGTFRDATDDVTCTQCPAGSFCPEGATLPTPCPVGSEAVAGSSVCTLCAPGTYRSDVATQDGCEPCLAGHSCSFPSADPIMCSAGTSSPAGVSSCTACTAGTFAAAPGTGSCDACTAGHACPVGTIVPVPCEVGTFANVGQCSACPEGMVCGAQTETPSPCAVGLISGSGASVCSACPAGFSCPDSSLANIMACAAGTWSLDGETGCTSCPSGMECPFNDQAVQNACLQGTFSTGGLAACEVCPAGSSCSTTDAAPVVCPTGMFSLLGEVTCSACAAGDLCASGIRSTCAPGTFTLSSSSFETCSPCPAGFACPNADGTGMVECGEGEFSSGSAIECTTCPAGHACPDRTAATVGICPEGSFSDVGATMCTACDAGFSCPIGSVVQTPCASGLFSNAGIGVCVPCPAGMSCVGGVAAPCANGTYSPGSLEACLPCAAGFICPDEGSTTATPSDLGCPAGTYCVPGSVEPTPCPINTFGPRTFAGTVGDCLACPEGYACGETGLSDVTLVACPTGYYCASVDGVAPAVQVECPEGTFNPSTGAASLLSCQTCPAGSLCDAGSSNPTACPAGSFCPRGVGSTGVSACPAGTFSNAAGASSPSVCSTCPAGAWCAPGADEATACAVGTYNPTAGASSISACLPCLAGFECSTPGLSAPSAVCPAGHYCPIGTATGIVCPGGTMSVTTGLTTERGCTACSAGVFCDGVTTTTCPAGHYCPVGTAVDQEIPCPAGTFRASTGGSSIEACGRCTGGSFCSGGGSAVDGPCARGYFCPPGSVAEDQFACPAGTVGASTGLAGSGECSPCGPGNYCPLGSADPVPCPPGTFSSAVNNQNVLACAECPAGVACPAGSTNAANACPPGMYAPSASGACLLCPVGFMCGSSGITPNGLVPCNSGFACSAGTISQTSSPCSPGSICPAGVPTLCPSGTFNTNGGQQDINACQPCTGGRFCEEGTDDILGTGPCAAGHYCPAGSATATAQACPGGSVNPSEGGSSLTSCGNCPAGEYCPSGSSSGIQCSSGHYCPENSAAPVPCPAGTFSTALGLSAALGANGCTACDPGSYCAISGATAVTGLCDAGFFCSGGATSPRPTDEATEGGDICPMGAYCPEGSDSPMLCAAGTYNPVSGASDSAACVNCDAGMFCTVSGSATPTGLCVAGFVCAEGSSSGTAVPAGPGSFAPAGSAQAIPCPVGTYQPASQQAECLACDAGSVCAATGLSVVTACPPGGYCPTGSIQAIPCPAGTFFSGSLGAAVSLDDCTPCDAGRFCEGAGESTVTGTCDAGFICFLGSTSATPSGTGVDGDSGPCPMGHFCLSGTTSAAACPSGFYLPETGASLLSDCLPCPAGSFCLGTGLSEPTGLCDAGYFCDGDLDGPGTSSPTPAGGECPLGHFCPQGTTEPIPCPPGTFANETALGTCLDCPASFTCEDAAATPSTCPLASYCSEGEPEQRCPDGTYGPSAGLSLEEECLQCPLSQYCVDGVIAGQCSAGFICNIGASSPRPPDGSGPESSNGRCNAGTFCLEGATEEQPCPEGTVNAFFGGSQEAECGACPAGSVCTDTATATPCPIGHYCPLLEGRAGPIPCPPFTFNSNEGGSSLESCSVCVGGFFCNDMEAIGSLTSRTCPQGHYCEQGSPAGAVACSPGTFNPNVGSDSVDDCEECAGGFSCGEGSTDQTACPIGFYCPPGSGEPIQCPSGRLCLDVPSPAAIFSDCTAGFYCPDGTAELNCPLGAYCPVNSATFTRCPLGMFGDVATSSADGLRVSLEVSCTICEAGTFGGDPDRLECFPCEAGYICNDGATSARPSSLEADNGFPCPRGFYCPDSTEDPIACPAGTYSDVLAASDVSACIACPVGSFSDEAGQVACRLCGASATSLQEGATTCTCLGANRAYQVTDGQCLCIPLFEYLDENLDPAQGDSVDNCQPIVFDRCRDGDRSLIGDCLDDPAAYCRSVCPGSAGGDFDSATSACDCSNEVLVDALCDASCLATQERVFIGPGNALTFSNDVMIGVPDTGARRVVSVDGNGLVAPSLSCPDDVTMCVLEVIRVSSSGQYFGVYDASVGYLDALLSGVQPSVAQVSGLALVQTPVICLPHGGGILVDLWDSVDGSGVSHHPVYIKDSLINTDDSFDSTIWRQLDSIIQGGATVRAFATVFAEVSGSQLFTFGDAAGGNGYFVVQVLAPGLECAPGGKIVPSSSQAFAAAGISDMDQLTLNPDWVTAGALIGVLSLLLFFIVFVVYLFRSSKWREQKRVGGIHYRRLGMGRALSSIASTASSAGRRVDLKGEEGLIISTEKKLGSDGYWEDDRLVDLEGFTVKQLYDRLEDQSVNVAAQLATHKDELASFYHRMALQTEELKGLVGNKLEVAGVDAKVADPAATEWSGPISDKEKKRRVKLVREYGAVIKAQTHAVGVLSQARDRYHLSHAKIMSEIETYVTEVGADLVRSCDAAEKPNGRKVSAGRVNKAGRGIKHVADLLRRTTEVRAEYVRAAGMRPLCNEHDGAFLLTKDGTPIDGLKMMDANRQITQLGGYTERCKITGLVVPTPGVKAIALDGAGKPYGKPFVVGAAANANMHEYCIHPATGHCVPIAGNVLISSLVRVGVSPVTFAALGRTLPALQDTTVSAHNIVFDDNHREKPAPVYAPAGEGVDLLVTGTIAAPVFATDTSSLPYIPMPRSVYAGEAPDVLQPARLVYSPVKDASGAMVAAPGALMLHEDSQLIVPVLGVSIDHLSGVLLPVGGAFISPLTQSTVPIEIGALFVDEASGRALPIEGVEFCAKTGKVLPIVGTIPDAGNEVAAPSSAIESDGEEGETANLDFVQKGRMPAVSFIRAMHVSAGESKCVVYGATRSRLGKHAEVQPVLASPTLQEQVFAVHALALQCDAVQRRVRALVALAREVQGIWKGAPEKDNREALSARVPTVQSVRSKVVAELRRTERWSQEADRVVNGASGALALTYVLHSLRLQACESWARSVARSPGDSAQAPSVEGRPAVDSETLSAVVLSELSVRSGYRRRQDGARQELTELRKRVLTVALDANQRPCAETFRAFRDVVGDVSRKYEAYVSARAGEQARREAASSATLSRDIVGDVIFYALGVDTKIVISSEERHASVLQKYLDRIQPVITGFGELEVSHRSREAELREERGAGAVAPGTPGLAELQKFLLDGGRALLTPALEAMRKAEVVLASFETHTSIDLTKADGHRSVIHRFIRFFSSIGDQLATAGSHKRKLAAEHVLTADVVSTLRDAVNAMTQAAISGGYAQAVPAADMERARNRVEEELEQWADAQLTSRESSIRGTMAVQRRAAENDYKNELHALQRRAKTDDDIDEEEEQELLQAKFQTKIEELRLREEQCLTEMRTGVQDAAVNLQPSVWSFSAVILSLCTRCWMRNRALLPASRKAPCPSSLLQKKTLAVMTSNC